MMTIKQQLEKYSGIGPGFDFLRIFLAVAIVLRHGASLTEREWIKETPLWFADYALVPMFFALSGFLVTASAIRLSLRNFLINRGLRIIPALGVDIVICALIIGPIMTTAAIVDYFTHPDFYRYFWNIFGYIHYLLPGVFKDNPSDVVNGALWTVPFEIACYVFMSALIILKFVHRRSIVALITIAYLLVGLLVQGGYFDTPFDKVNKMADALFVERGSQLLTSFMMGILIYQYSDKIPYNKILAGVCAVITVYAVFFLDSSSNTSVQSRLLFLPALMYLTIWVGVTPVPIPKLFHSGDYSYGIYLYHVPILQAIIAVLPLPLLTGTGGWLLLICIGLPAVACLAAFSWHYIEKPILSLRKKFSFVARVRGVETKGVPTKHP